MVTSFQECQARPGQSLQAHLQEVASAAGSPEGPLQNKLRYLAGLLHDVGKASPTWQNYLRRSVENERGLETLPHAYIGAALFALYGKTLLSDDPTLEMMQQYLLLVQDLQDHHGVLRNRYHPPHPIKVPWHESMKRYPPKDTFFADLNALIQQHFPSLPINISDYPSFKKQLTDLERTWPRQLKTQNRKLHGVTEGRSTAYAPWICRDITGYLIAADRLSADSKIEQAPTLTAKTAQDALTTFKTRLDAKYREAVEKGHHEMAEKRRAVHEQALQNYLNHQESRWFTLNLPVGWGKTLTSLRAALESAVAGHTERIVYVAPYLAILTQAAKEIREATELEVLEHHHLALLSEAPEAREGLDILTMESWRAPVVATTFNQLFRAIFPATAQQSIRIPALEHSFIIVDEPQIVNASVYNAFLKGLETLCERLDARAMLVTATLPPTYYGLSQPPHDVTPAVKSAHRYTLTSHETPWTEAQLVDEALERLEQHRQVAIILNTIADAVSIYQLARERTESDICLTLHGMMTPLHKAHQIQEIAKRLANAESVLVISTQVLEAGVDLSFRCLLRARPILSSVIQAAGRANRHAEGELAQVEVFDLLRESGRDARKLIYQNEQQRRTTDELLTSAGSWSEAEASILVVQYFEKLSLVDANIAIFERFKQAAEGQWRQLAKLTPFDTVEDEDGNEVSIERNASVFVATAKTSWIGERIAGWMQKFGIEHVPDLYHRYQDKRFMAGLEFSDRKRFLSLLRQFTAPLRWRLVPQICGRIDIEKASILRAQDDSTYHLDTGFGHLLSRKDFDDYERRLEARMTRNHDEDMW